MTSTITLTAADGHALSAYRAEPPGAPRGGIVVVQEIFGVNDHIRKVADGFAGAGYSVVAPALFDRVQRGVELGYGEADIAAGRAIRARIAPDDALKDVAAARDALKGAGRTGIVGYCWGGFIAYIAATRLDGLSAAVSYYGGGIGAVAGETPRCPVLMHFGETDHAIPLAEVDKVRQAQGAKVEIQIYPAGHGFNCDQRGSYDAASAKTALARTLAFFARHLG